MQELLGIPEGERKEGQAIMRRAKGKGKGKKGKGKKKTQAAVVVATGDGGGEGGQGGDNKAPTTDVLGDSTGGLLGGLAGDVMKAIGKVQEVIITWSVWFFLLLFYMYTRRPAQVRR